MNEQQKHEMILDKTHPSGADEWTCPICGRRILISWEPKFKRTVLEAGNPEVMHDGFKIDMPMGNLPAIPDNGRSSHEYLEDIKLNIDETKLAPWESWLNERGFEDLWDIDDQ